MAPEYGATMGFFPVDDETIRYLELTGRPREVVERVEVYCKEQGLFRYSDSTPPEYSEYLDLDLSTVEASLAGPKRPQDRIAFHDLGESFREVLSTPVEERGFGIDSDNLNNRVALNGNGATGEEIRHGSVVIAAITSCTNTSNPSVMLAAGLVAKKAVEKGLQVKPYVKTSLAPGSRVVTEYLEKTGLLEPLAKLGFNVVGYGCTTCIGNSGPLPGEVVKGITSADLIAAAVLSGNRNFEGRVHPYVRANYLASPPLVVIYALTGNVDFDPETDPVGFDSHGEPVFFRELWPSNEEVNEIQENALNHEMYHEKYADVFMGSETWNEIESISSSVYPWNPGSTYIQEPPFFKGMQIDPDPLKDIHQARALLVLGDSITTDHISPAGTFSEDSPAGKYLLELGVSSRDFNTYGARRGNDRIMTRGTFANIRLKNQLVPGTEGGITLHFPDEKRMSVYAAARMYEKDKVPMIVLAGKEYGTGSSRDWAAKGTKLLGVKAVIAKSYERIHRSNLFGMGVLPLQFKTGDGVDELGLTGKEVFDILGLSDFIQPRQQLVVRATGEGGDQTTFKVDVRLESESELEIFKNGGILEKVLRSKLQ
jgi:aconitate hydratase